jgi:hypothetical protein
MGLCNERRWFSIKTFEVMISSSFFFFFFFDDFRLPIEFTKLVLIILTIVVYSYPGTDIFLICFDIARKSTFDLVTEEYVPQVRLHCPEALMLVKRQKKNIFIYFCGLVLKIICQSFFIFDF